MRAEWGRIEMRSGSQRGTWRVRGGREGRGRLIQRYHLLFLLLPQWLGLRSRLLLLLPLLLLEEAEPEDVAERGAGGGLQELAVAAEHAQHLV